ncbi:condensation domain-containing protein [Sporolactobacillus terrae]|uniref:condensation domain-containing protein n=1 Tax=Sporolactobacillus terrae TaxID=269673 RepID=UPI001119E7C9|nr:condensation domain-containing protein [Sporolactobacillus terrae]
MATKQKIFAAESSDVKHFISGLNKKNDHYLHAVIHFDTTIDERVLIQAVHESQKLFPLLSCRYVEATENAYWEESDWSASDMVHVVQAMDREQAVQEQLTRKLNEKKGPQLSIAIIRKDERDSLAVILNHMLCDGGGFNDYLALLSAHYSRFIDGSTCAHPNADHLGSRSIKQVFDALNDAQLNEMKHARLMKHEQDERDYLPLKGDERQPFIMTHQLSAKAFDQLRGYVKSKGATINDALFAAYVCALARVIKAEQIILDCPVNLRSYLPKEVKPGFCNLTSNITCIVPRDAGIGFDQALMQVKKVMDKEKKSFKPLKVYWELEEAYHHHHLDQAKKLFPSIYRIPVNGMTNIGIIDEHKLRFSGLSIRDVFISGSIKYAPYFQIAVTTFQKRMTFATNFYGTNEDKACIDSFITNLINHLPIQS